VYPGGTGATELDAAEAADPTPLAPLVVIVNVYEVPLVNPETVIGLEEPVPVKLPGDEVTV
jgi:hypothetical protein